MHRRVSSLPFEESGTGLHGVWGPEFGGKGGELFLGAEDHGEPSAWFG